MAKFSRFDPRNKKNNRNKIRSLEKDLRIHEKKQKNRKFKLDLEIKDSKDENLEDDPLWSNQIYKIPRKNRHSPLGPPKRIAWRVEQPDLLIQKLCMEKGWKA